MGEHCRTRLKLVLSKKVDKILVDFCFLIWIDLFSSMLIVLTHCYFGLFDTQKLFFFSLLVTLKWWWDAPHVFSAGRKYYAKVNFVFLSLLQHLCVCVRDGENQVKRSKMKSKNISIVDFFCFQLIHFTSLRVKGFFVLCLGDTRDRRKEKGIFFLARRKLFS